jgi:hypothetical protein
MARVHLGLDFSSVSPEVTQAMMASNSSPYAMRPYVDGQGRGYLSYPIHGVTNADGTQRFQHMQVGNALLRYDEWKAFDNVIEPLIRQKTRVYQKLTEIVTPLTMTDAMNHTVLQWQVRDNFGQAIMSMDPARRTTSEQGNFDVRYMPLPIVHSDFSFSLRDLMISRNGGAGLDTTAMQEAAVAISEKIERLTIGVDDEYYFGGGYIYGLTNHPNRMTATLTDPEDNAWTVELFCNEIVDLTTTMHNARRYGPYHVLYGNGWMTYMQRRYNQFDSTPLAAAVRRLDKIASFEQADFLTGLEIIVIEPQAQFVRAVIGMNPTPVQWSNTPFDVQMKLMAIMLPQIRDDYNDETGILHAIVE